MCATVSGAGRGRYAIALPSPPTTSLIAIAPTVSPYNAPEPLVLCILDICSRIICPGGKKAALHAADIQ